jgi:hypothetical protein
MFARSGEIAPFQMNKRARPFCRLRPVRSLAMTDTIRVKINGNEQHLPREMLGFHATLELARRLGVNPSGLVLRRVSDQAYIGDSASIGEVVRDHDELEFALRPQFKAAA